MKTTPHVCQNAVHDLTAEPRVVVMQRRKQIDGIVAFCLGMG